MVEQREIINRALVASFNSEKAGFFATSQAFLEVARIFQHGATVQTVKENAGISATQTQSTDAVF